MIRVVVVEDTRDIAEGIRDFLTRAGMDVRAAHDGSSGLDLASTWRPDVVILDLMLPDISGYEVLHRLRESGYDLPVLILSAKSDEVAKVRGFREGADDYVTKPFGIRELAARVHVLARRAAQVRSAPAELSFGALTVQPAARRVRLRGEEVPLRPKELDLLLTLISRRDEVVPRQQLLAEVWAYEPGVESRTVDWHVAELRRKLEDRAGTPHLIETVRKSGYRWIAGSGSD